MAIRGTDLTQTVKMNELFSPTALPSQVLFHIFDGALIEEGRLLERVTYFKILKNKNSDFSYAF